MRTRLAYSPLSFGKLRTNERYGEANIETHGERERESEWERQRRAPRTSDKHTPHFQRLTSQPHAPERIIFEYHISAFPKIFPFECQNKSSMEIGAKVKNAKEALSI